MKAEINKPNKLWQREGQLITVNHSGLINSLPVRCKESTNGCVDCKFLEFNCHGGKVGRPMCFANERPDRLSVFFKG